MNTAELLKRDCGNCRHKNRDLYDHTGKADPICVPCHWFSNWEPKPSLIERVKKLKRKLSNICPTAIKNQPGNTRTWDF